MTKGQLADLETIKYFIPACMEKVAITDQDIKDFFAYSERGQFKERAANQYVMDGFNALCQGKRWRGIHLHELWEPGVLEGSVSYYTLLGGEVKKEVMPRSVVEFMKKELFKGTDAELIEKSYQDILWQWTPWYKKIWKRLSTALGS